MSRRFFSVPSKALRDSKSIVPKVHDKEAGKIRWTTGPIEGTDYALAEDGSIRNLDPRVLNKKERRRDRANREAKPGGHTYTCWFCKGKTYHFPSKTRKKPKGYESFVTAETYECSACGNHIERETVDGMITAFIEAKTQAAEDAKRKAEDEARRESGQAPLYGSGEWSPEGNAHPSRDKGASGDGSILKRSLTALRKAFRARDIPRDDRGPGV